MFDQILVIIGITSLVMISPGPDMVIVLRNTLVDGRAAGLLTSLGVLTGNLVHITYCVLGIGWVISKSILAFTLLKYAGAVYLIYLGVMSFKSSTTKLETAPGDIKVRNNTWFMQGFVNNILNPKGTLFYLGVFTMVITPSTSAGITLVLIFTMMLVSTSFWLFFVYTLDYRVVREFINRFQQVVNRIFGMLLIFLGLKVMFMEK